MLEGSPGAEGVRPSMALCSPAKSACSRTLIAIAAAPGAFVQGPHHKTQYAQKLGEKSVVHRGGARLLPSLSLPARQEPRPPDPVRPWRRRSNSETSRLR